MKKIVKLTEADLKRIVKRVIIEQREDEDDEYYDKGPQTPDEVADKWYEKTDDDFFISFIEQFPSKMDFYGQVLEYLQNEYGFGSPGEDYLDDFIKDLNKVNW